MVVGRKIVQYRTLIFDLISNNDMNVGHEKH